MKIGSLLATFSHFEYQNEIFRLGVFEKYAGLINCTTKYAFVCLTVLQISFHLFEYLILNGIHLNYLTIYRYKFI